jgi:hypothetical protein
MSEFSVTIRIRAAELRSEIDAKRVQATRLREEIIALEKNLAALTQAQQVLHKFFPEQVQAEHPQPELPTTLKAHTDSSFLDPQDTTPINDDYAGLTLLESATLTLQEINRPMHTSEIARAVLRRGYRSPRGVTDVKTVDSNVWDALRRIRANPKIPILFVGRRMFRYAENKVAIEPKALVGIRAEEGGRTIPAWYGHGHGI